ncbi:MAG: type IV toxin-antitoxin system AbiEi family antitoxin domain-containing protein [Saprospiraceae bacterium]|nr:type IV toxin-antitoxin system AbiEi family antitoxin domain-containing protein [Saprospiraceae bacterium]
MQKTLLLYILAVVFAPMNQSDQILRLFGQNKGYARTRDLLDVGLHHRYLDMLVQEGAIVKIKRGLYRLASLDIADELEEVSRIVPEGVICLFSAWNYYELSDFVPLSTMLPSRNRGKSSCPIIRPSGYTTGVRNTGISASRKSPSEKRG